MAGFLLELYARLDCCIRQMIRGDEEYWQRGFDGTRFAADQHAHQCCLIEIERRAGLGVRPMTTGPVTI